MLARARRPTLFEKAIEGAGMDPRDRDESLMEATGLGLLPGMGLALGIVVIGMALLLTGSMWAVAGVLAMVVAITAWILAVVIALVDDGRLGRWLRLRVPGLTPGPHS
jgi:hypothetical protein